MDVDKRPHNDKASQDIPQPIVGSAETIPETSLIEFIAYTVADPVIPDKGNDAKCKPRKNKENQAVMHGVTPVLPSHIIDFLRNVRHHYKAVDSESN